MGMGYSTYKKYNQSEVNTKHKLIDIATKYLERAGFISCDNLGCQVDVKIDFPTVKLIFKPTTHSSGETFALSGEVCYKMRHSIMDKGVGIELVYDHMDLAGSWFWADGGIPEWYRIERIDDWGYFGESIDYNKRQQGQLVLFIDNEQLEDEQIERVDVEFKDPWCSSSGNTAFQFFQYMHQFPLLPHLGDRVQPIYPLKPRKPSSPVKMFKGLVDGRTTKDVIGDASRELVKLLKENLVDPLNLSKVSVRRMSDGSVVISFTNNKVIERGQLSGRIVINFTYDDQPYGRGFDRVRATARLDKLKIYDDDSSHPYQLNTKLYRAVDYFTIAKRLGANFAVEQREIEQWIRLIVQQLKTRNQDLHEMLNFKDWITVNFID